MEMNGSAKFRHRNSPSQRFMGFDLQPLQRNPNNDVAASAAATAPVPDDDFNEDEVFWTGDFTESSQRSDPSSSPARPHRSNQYQRSFRHVQNFGILAALPEDDQNRGELGGERSLLCRKPSIPSSPSSSSTSSSSSRMMMIQTIPRPQVPQEREYSQSMPVNVPVCSRMKTTEVAEAEGEDAENEMLPPHELIAKRYRLSGVSTFSVLEGAGRTLKGRDLRKVRNAVLQQTGFLD